MNVEDELSYEEWAGLPPIDWDSPSLGISLTPEMIDKAIEVLMDTPKGKLIISPYLSSN